MLFRSRITQFRSAINNLADRIQSKLFPTQQVINTEISEDEDLLTPTTKSNWQSLFKRPDLLSFLGMFIFSIAFSHSRFGAIAGGALPESPKGVSELWKLYAESWHQVGLGSSSATPSWVAVIAAIGSITFGNAQLFISFLFLFAPLVLFGAIFIWLRRMTTHIWLAIFGSLLYAVSPVALTTINSGRLGTLVVMVTLPLTLHLLGGTLEIEKLSYRRIFQLGLFLSVTVAFSLPFFIALGLFYVGLSLFDYLHISRDLLLQRVKYRALLLAIPFFVNSILGDLFFSYMLKHSYSFTERRLWT